MQPTRADLILGEIVKRLLKLRKQQGLSHEVLARRTGISRPAISHIENGKRRPSLLVCLKMAHAMDTELSTILKIIERVIPKSKS